jgi:hypothetical protein
MDRWDVMKLQEEFGFEYAAAIGSLTIRKLANFMRTWANHTSNFWHTFYFTFKVNDAPPVSHFTATHKGS